MRVVRRLTPSGVRLVFTGAEALESANAEAVKSASLKAVRGASEAIVDLSEIEFVDSAGVGVLVAVYRSMRQRGGRARFCGVRPGVRSVLEIIRLDEILDLVDDPLQASR